MKKKKRSIFLAAVVILGHTIIIDSSQVYSASVSGVQSETLQDDSIEGSVTEEINTDVVPTDPKDPQPITPTVPPITPEKPDITLPPVTIGEPVPITPTVPPLIPEKPDNTLPPVTIGEPVPITPTAPPIVPERPDISLPSVSLTSPETADLIKPESTSENDKIVNETDTNVQEKNKKTNLVTVDGQVKQVEENKEISGKAVVKEELPHLPNTWIEENIPLVPEHSPVELPADTEKKEEARKHAIAVHAAGTGGVVTGIGTSVLLLGILKKASWLKQFFGK